METSGVVDQSASGRFEGVGQPYFEDTLYRVRVKSLQAGNQPVVSHRDPLLLRDLDEYREDVMVAGPVNFGRQVGLSTFEISVGADTLTVTVEIFPAKVDYATDYEDMVHDVARKSRALALEYLRASHRRVGQESVDGNTGLEWLTLLRSEIGRLERALEYVNAHPQRALRSDTNPIRVDQVRRVDASTRRSVARGRGRGVWIQIPPLGKVHEYIPTIRRAETMDTSEHRWLRLHLKLIQDRLGAIHEGLLAEALSALKRQRSASARRATEISEVASFAGVIARLQRLPVFDNVTSPPPVGFSSLGLLSGIGYSDAYRSLTALKVGLGVDGDSLDASLKELHTLYETWCFIRLASALDRLASGRTGFADLVSVEESGIRVRLRKGSTSSVIWQEDGRQITVTYGPNFAGLTGTQSPDIIVRFKHPGWPDMIVIFDAKYRVESSPQYVGMFGLPGPPEDAMGALHRYRDAILVEAQGSSQMRPIVKGVALYPLGADQSAPYELSRLKRALDTVGIGAIPFLPSNTKILDRWLERLFVMEPTELAWAGPPFGAWEERQRRESSAARDS